MCIYIYAYSHINIRTYTYSYYHMHVHNVHIDPRHILYGFMVWPHQFRWGQRTACSRLRQSCRASHGKTWRQLGSSTHPAEDVALGVKWCQFCFTPFQDCLICFIIYIIYRYMHFVLHVCHLHYFRFLVSWSPQWSIIMLILSLYSILNPLMFPQQCRKKNATVLQTL